jgi:type II secretory pathway pseudopilin PulG
MSDLISQREGIFMKMKSTVRSILGVTLLEIMLVLAIAAMIIVMSVRYYQSATNSQQAAAAFNQAIAINAAMDALSAVSGDYSTVGGTTAVTNYIGATKTPSGGTIAVTAAAATPSKFSVTLPLTASTCTTVLAQVNGISKIKNSGTAAACDASNVLTYTYDKTQ